MRLLLAGDDPVLAILREQFHAAEIFSRELTGVGFYTHYSVPDDIQRLPGAHSFFFGDVEAAIPSLQHGAGFLLRVTDGALDFLEGYTYDEPWPDDMTGFTVGYMGGTRDIEQIQHAWKR
jgi:hypothetical protein